MTQQEAQKISEQLKKLKDDVRFQDLNALLSGVTFVELSYMFNDEPSHTYFLSRLFDVAGSPELNIKNSSLWKKILLKNFLENQCHINLPGVDFNCFRAVNEHVFEPGYGRVDIVIYYKDSVDPTKNTVVLIENKIDAEEGADQLKLYKEGLDIDKEFNYPNKRYIFLTPSGRKPKTDFYGVFITASYANIVNAINSALPYVTDMQISAYLRDYVKYIRRRVENIMDLDEQLKQVYNELYKDYPEAIDFLGKTKSDDKLIRIADEISKILLKQAATRGLYLIGKKNGVVGGGRIKFKTQVMNNLLNVNSFDDNPIQYEISADIGNGRMSAYAYPYNADRTNNDINKVIAACGTVQSNNGKKVKQGIWSHVLDFNGIIDIDTICSQIESGNTADLTNIVISYLDQIAHAESEIAKLI